MEETTSVQIEKIRRQIEDYEEKGYDKSFEEEWKAILDTLNALKAQVYRANMFSDNEEFSEVKTEDIKFMLIAFYQSEIIQKFQINRKNILNFALKFYSEFFTLLKQYSYLTKDQIKTYEASIRTENDKEPKKEDFAMLSQQRQNKIEMFKYKKALSEKLKRIEKEKNFDDNREYWTEFLNLCFVKMLENIKMIYMEIDSLNYLEKMKKENHGQDVRKDHKPAKEKMEILQIKSPEDLLKIDFNNNKLAKNLNFVTSCSNPGCMDCFQMINGFQKLDDKIVKLLPDNIRETVFRNPNPTEMTMDEFAEMQCQHMKENKEKEEEHQKNKSDSDSDIEAVSDKKTQKAREWDDWKDDHKKGSGNRMGK